MRLEFEAAYLIWCIWSLAQSYIAAGVDFDYLGYAILRHQRFQEEMAKVTRHTAT